MKRFHILNGDCLFEQLKNTTIEGEFIICRECLMDGNVKASNLNDFWEIRANHISKTYHASPDEYYRKSVRELERINSIPEQSEVCLWFEHDLFCQVNMWFCLSLLANRSDLKICRIFPIFENQDQIWKGFSNADSSNLEQAYAQRIFLTQNDIDLGNQLWEAYQNDAFARLNQLSSIKSSNFQYLEEVCQAHIDRFPTDNSLGRPEKVIRDIIEQTTTDFYPLFSIFSEKEGIYGFGDLQVKTIYDQLMKTKN
ncbi:DUF1835 domain-containing protein [Arcicella sp. LKC2W]|uniref:DUF1835 domain-containing protein n=1 Tax=Arcicella sp. LKC2W TaxID=2984198 RepID=UPI002B20E81B|nr:DUF1835 domain-containing protein [Arcicella sp. LKC2W]MEA5458580.1 DUF1835 domain-containing protein [Arcicella sp. LKC2W]